MLECFGYCDVGLGEVVGPINTRNITPIVDRIQWQLFQIFLVIVTV